jgi:phosphoglucosamine mutase
MRALADANKTLAQLKSEMTKFPQMMINVKLPKRVDISQNLQINQVVAEAEKQLDERGRVLLRPSGTEPVIRVMVEGEDSVLVNNLVNQIADVVRQQVK